MVGILSTIAFAVRMAEKAVTGRRQGKKKHKIAISIAKDSLSHLAQEGVLVGKKIPDADTLGQLIDETVASFNASDGWQHSDTVGVMFSAAQVAEVFRIWQDQNQAAAALAVAPAGA